MAKTMVRFLLLCITLVLMTATALAVTGADDNEWTIILDYNDGVSRAGAMFVEKGQTVTLPTTALRAGYTFEGWKTADGETVDTAAYQPGADVTLVADWAVGKNTVTFLDIVKKKEKAIDSREYEFGTKLTDLPVPEKKGYQFRYWSLSADGERIDFDSYTLTGDASFYAVWMEESAKEYKVVFKASAFADMKDKELFIVEGGQVKKADAPKDLERDGYKFEGWTDKAPKEGNDWTIDEYPAKSAPKTVKIPLKPKADTELYAVWTIQQYMAIFNANYTDAPYKNGVVDSYKLLSNENVTETAVQPTREGYTFEGWYTKAVGGEKVDFTKEIRLKANTGYYAHWVNNGVATDTFHAEYTRFDPDAKYFGYSGSVNGTGCIVKDAGTVGPVLKDDYPTNSKLAGGNGYYVSYQYERGDTLRFVINSSKATTATLKANLAVEVDSMDIASTGENATSVIVNGKELDYKLTILRIFQEYELGKIELLEGENVIELVVANDNTVMGGTYRAVGFMTDYIKLADTEAVFTWAPIYDNLENN